MNINYDEIITKANERKEKLKAFQEHSLGAEAHANAILRGLLYFSNLRYKAEALDSEGRAMLGGTYQRAVGIGFTAGSTYDIWTMPNPCGGGDGNMIMRLVDALK